jgi:hypothetical protein
MGIDVELGLTKLAALYGVGDEETLRRLIEWSGQVGAGEFGRIVKRWTTHLDQGGDPRDLLREPLPGPRPVRRRRTRTGRELIVPRLLTLMLEWVRRHQVSPLLRERLVRDLVTLRKKIARAA